MAFTYDVSTDRGKVRLLSTDRKAARPIFDDDEIDAFLAMNGNEVKLAAAAALEQMASNEAMVLKVISNNGLSTNGAAVAQALMARAAKLREEYQQQADEDFCGFDIAEYADNPAQTLELLIKESMRDA
ncbi:MAG: hypothetical protein WC683_07515 [bacterium]|jgi:hypothetical protein